MTRYSVLAALLALAVPCGCTDLDGSKNRPVTKVITLLKDMLKQLENEAEQDEEIYDKMACWCETNDKEKTKAIADAEAKIADLTTKIAEYTAASARLNTEIKHLEQEKAANQEALDKATEIRRKELAEFNAEEKDVLQSISSLKAAILVLSKHNSGSLLQIPREHILGIASTLQQEMQKHADILTGVLSHSERKVVDSFIQAPDDFFDASPTFKQSYAPQSGEIFGILQQMKETFETNLAASQKEETANAKAYEELKAAKLAEIKAGQEQIDTKTAELAETDQKNADAKEDIVDTKEALGADEQFLLMLKEKCSMTDREWETRQKTRQLEMEAVSKALAILSGDDAHDTFTRTFNFIQMSTSEVSVRRKASQLLVAFSQKMHNPSLAVLATQVRLDAFTKVIKAIDDMIAQLKKAKAEEIKHRDFCIEEFHNNEAETAQKNSDHQDLVDKIESLEDTIKTLTQEIDELKAQIAAMQDEMKKAGEDRETENKEFQATIADQRATQNLLQNALTVLKDFYNKKAKLALLQSKEPAGPPPPPGFDSYQKSAGSGGVMGMIQKIIDDAKALEKETVRSEEEAQQAYEAFVKETNNSIQANSDGIVDKSDTRAKAEADKVQATESKDAVLLELEQLSNYKTELHQSCNFVMKNFEIRQTARDEEVEALGQAKAILRGAKFDE